jgi:SOS-response transcriptional repressor LexA
VIALEKPVETVGERVRRCRQAAGMSQRALADKAGTSQQVIQHLETKGEKGSTHLVAIAQALGVPAEYLWTGEKNIRPVNFRDDEGGSDRLIGLSGAAPVIGTVGAGLWRETQVNPAASFGQEIPYLPTKTNNGIPQYGLRVEGNSMNKVVQPGEFVAVCLISDGARFYPNDIVVVEKSRGGLYETTLKRLKKLTDDTVVLEPESDDDAFVPLIMKKDGDEEIRIVAVAVGKYAPF